jgi:DNA-binding response OmpR family regulator
VPASDPGDAPTRYSQCHPFIVEDDEDFKLLLARALAKAGVSKDRLRMVADGEQAIETLKRVTPDPLLRENLPPSLIVLDLNLPKMSGLELLAWIRERPELQQVPVFMLTSSEHPDHIARAFELRTDSYFVKPANSKELQEIVEGMLGFWFTRIHRRLPNSGVTQSETS